MAMIIDGLKLYFPSIFYYASDIISEEANQKIIDATIRLKEQHKSGHKNWDCDIYTTFKTYDIKKDESFSPLISAINDQVKAYGISIKSKNQLRCAGAWFNIGGVKQYQETHTHIGGMNKLSVVYYCSTPEGSAPTIFKPFYEITNTLVSEIPENEYIHTDIRVTPEERKLIIFPSHIPHFVPQGTNTEQRITISANYG